MRPPQAVVYLMYDRLGILLYIGCSVRVDDRIYDHSRNKNWFNRARSIKIRTFKTTDAARVAEARLIRELRPMFNKEIVSVRKVNQKLRAWRMA